jgi:large subunit ribosomal protein L54
LKGLNFLKNKTDPVAMEDSEYPPWLWDILNPKAKAEDENLAADLYCTFLPFPSPILPQPSSSFPEHFSNLNCITAKSKSKRTAAKKALKQGKITLDSLVQKVPIYEQSLDLPTGDGTVEGAIEAARARKELTKAMREKRRSVIKESNFLKTMG